MSLESVRQYFMQKGLEDPVFELSESGATVELASKTIGVSPELIAKTLAFKLKGKNILIVVKGDARIDNRKFKDYFGVKSKMLDLSEVEEITGHPVGGVCPFGLKNKLEIYLDISMKNFEYVYPSAGSITSAMKISPYAIEELTDATWVDICV